MKELTEKNEELAIVIQKKAQPSLVPENLNEQQKRATFNWLRNLWHKVKGYTASDVLRLKEAAIQNVEGEALKKLSEAKKNEAEAARLFAESERIKRESAIKDLEIANKKKSLVDSITEEDMSKLERVANATERLNNAISSIRQKGGDVGFDSETIKKILESNDQELDQ